MIGPHVTDLIAEAMLITSWEATALEAATIHHPHPTLSEGVGEAMLKLAGKPLHTAVGRGRSVATNVEPAVAAGDRPLPDDRLRHVLYLLKLARYFDERMEALYRQGRLPGAIYSGRGQEGTHVGVASALEEGDSLFPTHRDLTAQLTKGLDLKRVMAQFWGRIDGYTRGRDGNSHIGDWHGNKTFTVMSHLPIAYPVAIGAAWAYQRRDEPAGGHGDLRRRRHVQRQVARILELVRRLPSPGGVGREQQRLRLLDAEPAGVPGGHHRRARGGVRDAGGACGRRERPRGLRGREGERSIEPVTAAVPP